MADPVQLVPTKSDQEIADSLKERLAEAYKPVLALLNEADRAGFMCNVGCGKDAFKKYVVQHLQILKEY